MRVEWHGYEGSEEQFSWEPLENMIEDVPDMAWPFIEQKFDIKKDQFIKVFHRKDIYFQTVYVGALRSERDEPLAP